MTAVLSTELAERIYAAFAEAPRPARSEIAPHSCQECDEVAEILSGFDSRSVPDDKVQYLNDSLPLLSPKAYRYYLPRYIAFSLLRSDVSSSDLLMMNLVPEGMDYGPRDRFVGFTTAERRAVREYLLYMSGSGAVDAGELSAAFDYWSKDA